MDFGKIEHIDEIDFALPAMQEVRLIPNNKPLEVYIGPPIWSNKAWIGKIYPSNVKDNEMLHFYCRQFNAIELNVTHYQIPDDKIISRWKSAATPGFKFCPKFPQEISHEKQLVQTENLTVSFFNAINKLDENLGTTFLQLPPTFSPKQFPIFENYLKTLPNGFEIAVEFRHPDWFLNKEIWRKTIDLLHKKQIGTVITDVAGRRDVLHQSLSTNTLTLRFVGNELHKTDFSRTEAWINMIHQYLEKGLNRLYIFIHCGENLYAPELTNYWIEQLNVRLSTQLKKAVIRPEVIQTSLF